MTSSLKPFFLFLLHTTIFLVHGKVEIHPMMYLALSYDHRIIDGKESVGFLLKVKELLENPVKELMNNNIKKSLEI